VQIGSPLLSTAALCPFRPRRSASPCRPGCPQGTRGSTSRHRSRGVAHVSGAPRHGATGSPAARVPGPPTGPVARPTGTAERPVRASREPVRGPRRGAPRLCATPRERCHERHCRSASPCRPGCPQGTRSSTSRHRSRGVAPVSGAPRHGATWPPAVRAPGDPYRPGRSTFRCRREARLRHPRDAIFKPRARQVPSNGPYARRKSRCARATARSAEVMRDTAGAVSRAPTSPSTRPYRLSRALRSG
jgi:hypothetical protein